VQMTADAAVQVEGDGNEGEQSYASGMQQHPRGGGLPRAQITRGKNRLALTTGLGEARGANPYELLSGFAGMQTRRFGGFCYSGVPGVRPRVDGAVHAADSARPASVAQSAHARKSAVP
jgi:hypothetical protein